MSFMNPTPEDRRRAQANMTAKAIEDEPTINQMSQLANRTAKYIAPRKARRERFNIVNGSKPVKSKNKIRAQRKKQRQNRRSQ
jgi:hypothetical protein